MKYTIYNITGWVSTFFSPADSHTEGLLVLLHLRLEGDTEVDTEAKRRFVSFKVTLSLMTELSIFMPFHSGGCTWEQLARGLFLEGLRTKLYEK